MKGWVIKPNAANVIDLSYPIKPGMTLSKSTYPDLEFKPYVRAGGACPSVIEVDETGYPLAGKYAQYVNTGPDGFLEGYGTHVESSSHNFGTRGRTIDQYPLSTFICPGVVIKIMNKAKTNPEYKVTVDDLLAWQKKYGKIPDGAIIVLNTGWGKYWGDYNAFFGIDEKGKSHLPGISPEACQWLVDNCHISAVGTDTNSISGSPSVLVPDFPKGRRAHSLAGDILMSPPHNILHMAYMANVDRLPESGSLIICAPINFVGGYGGTVRALAVLP